MLKISNLTLKLKEENKIVIEDVSLSINPGEVHFLSGRNGSGKSSLVNAIMGYPGYEVVKGEMEWDEIRKFGNLEIRKKGSKTSKELRTTHYKLPTDELNTYNLKLTTLELTDRSLLGIFLAHQTPVEIPGVSLIQFLRLIYNTRQQEGKKVPLFKFRKILEEAASKINYPKTLLERNLNEGFSGGEKKKTEVLQMLILKPKLVMLDEIDSGLDEESIKDVFEGINTYRKENPETAFLIISHYKSVQELIKPDFIHRLEKGAIKK